MLKLGTNLWKFRMAWRIYIEVGDGVVEKRK